MDVPSIRTQIRKQRCALSSTELALHGSAVCEFIIKQNFYLNSSRLAIYLPVDGEISSLALVEHARRHDKKIYLPVLSPIAGHGLWFVEWTTDTIFRPNRFGIPEPKYSSKEIIPANNLDLVITPLVAFDPHCHRIGMGGGYYDRTFGFLLARQYWIKPKLIGIAHEIQKIQQIMPEVWDVPLQGVITERCFYLPQ